MSRRTLAMRTYVAAYAGVVVLLVYFAAGALDIVPRPGGGGAGPPKTVVLAVVGVIVALGLAGLLAAAFWKSAPRRSWFWPVAALPPILWFLPDTAQLVGLLIHPPSWWAFVLAGVAVVTLPALAVSAVISMRQARTASGP